MNTPKLTLSAALILTLAAACQPPDRDALTVPVALQNETPSVAKGTIVVDYSRAGAKVLAEEGSPACAFILPGVSGTFADDGRGVLTVKVQSKRGLRGPADVVACRMLSTKGDATAADIRGRLEVKLTEAEDGAGKVLDLTIPAAKARRATVAAPATAEAEPAAGDTTEAGMRVAEIEARKHAKEAGEIVAKPAPTPPIPPKAAPATPPALPAAARAPLPPPSQPAGGPASANIGRSASNSPGLSPAQQARTAPDTNDPGPSSGTPGPGKDDGFDDSPSDDDTAPAFEITARVTRAVGKLGALQFEIAFQGDSGGWAGRGANVACDALTDGLAATNFPGGREVKVGLVSLQGVNTPADVVKCIFRSHERVTTASFTVNVTDASNINTDPLPAVPQMEVTRVTPI